MNLKTTRLFKSVGIQHFVLICYIFFVIIKHMEEVNQFSKSQLKLINSLLEILKYKEFLSISVKEICIAASINRSTFYAYYETTFDLLMDARSYLTNYFCETAYKDVDVKNFDISKGHITKDFLIPYLTFIKENKDYYLVFNKHSAPMENEKLFNLLIKNIAKPTSNLKNYNNEDVIRYITIGSIEAIKAIIKAWIKRDFIESEKEISDIILKTLGKN